MNLKSIFTAILVVCSITFVNAQSKDILAKSAMLNADEAYANGKYKECIDYLNDAVTNLGKTNSRIQYLKVKSLMAIGTNDIYNKTIWLQADTALKLFFDITPENSYVPEKYEEMLMAVSKVKEYVAEIEKSEQVFKQRKFGSFTDPRDGKTYKTIDIGKQTWLAENLAYKAENGCWVYDNDSKNVETYGYLYNWETAKNACPSGWHLPSMDEWNTLIYSLGGKSVAGFKMREEGTIHWGTYRAATNESGFTALPGGGYSEGKFFMGYSSVAPTSFWWSTMENDEIGMCFLNDDNYTSAGGTNYSNDSGFSVRCVKDK